MQTLVNKGCPSVWEPRGVVCAVIPALRGWWTRPVGRGVLVEIRMRLFIILYIINNCFRNKIIHFYHGRHFSYMQWERNDSLYFYYYFFSFFSWDRIVPWSLGWSWTHYVAQACLRFTEIKCSCLGYPGSGITGVNYFAWLEDIYLLFRTGSYIALISIWSYRWPWTPNLPASTSEVLEL